MCVCVFGVCCFFVCSVTQKKRRENEIFVRGFVLVILCETAERNDCEEKQKWNDSIWHHHHDYDRKKIIIKYKKDRK